MRVYLLPVVVSTESAPARGKALIDCRARRCKAFTLATLVFMVFTVAVGNGPHTLPSVLILVLTRDQLCTTRGQSCLSLV